MTANQLQFLDQSNPQIGSLSFEDFQAAVERFSDFHKPTIVLKFPDSDFDIPVYVNEFWTSRQRAAHTLHGVSYRACFKPQLPRFFIQKLSCSGDVVYDPFMGRGTTVIEAALCGRTPVGTDINPLSKILVAPRLNPPPTDAIVERLRKIPLEKGCSTWEGLSAFYHPSTLVQITNLRNYLLEKEEEASLDVTEEWIRMVATNRLTGHSPGFFFGIHTTPESSGYD